MRISDEERREIAKAIRDRIWRNERSSWDVVFELSCIDALGRCLSRNKDAALLLADLIDRPTTKRDGAGGIYWRCTRCGAFNRKDAVTDCCGVIPSRYCANCGADVVTDDD